MKYKPGTLVEIYQTVDVDPKGVNTQSLEPRYIGKLCLVLSYYPAHNYYLVLPVSENESIEVYEKEIRFVS